MSSALIPFAVYGFVCFCIDLRTAYLSTKPVDVGGSGPVGKWADHWLYVDGEFVAILWPDGSWKVYEPSLDEALYGTGGTREHVEAVARRAGWEFRMVEEVSDA